MTQPPPTKGSDEIFCSSCGRIIKREAAFCVNCGVEVKGISKTGNPSANAIPPSFNPKSKITAILLAVFLGYWTWLYTHQRNGWKFWLNVGLSILSWGISLASLLPVVLVWGLAVWLWAIIDTATKSNDYFARYPHG